MLRWVASISFMFRVSGTDNNQRTHDSRSEKLKSGAAAVMPLGSPIGSARGLKTRNMVELCAFQRNRSVDVEALAKGVDFNNFLERDVNQNLSGGEIKRSEMLQLLAQDPDLVLLDEPESGVDLENMVLIGETINLLLHRGVKYAKEKSHKNTTGDQLKSALVITHTGHILDYITADKGQVLFNGQLCCSRNAREILKWIGEFGYEECVRCTMDILK